MLPTPLVAALFKRISLMRESYSGHWPAPSSSHALIGGLVGAGLAKAGFSAVVWAGVLKTVSGIVLAPGLGCLTALLLVLVVSWTFMRFTPFGADHFFRRAQLVSASLYSLGHGGNDAQKTMGIIAVLLYSQGYLGSQFYIPFWVVLTCQAAIALGTLAGGWRIVRTMGSKITRLTPAQGFCAETGGSIMLFAATELGVPVSTTHTITGCIIGVGAAKKVSAVRWSVAREIITAWIVTIPAAGFMAVLFYYGVAIVTDGASALLFANSLAAVLILMASIIAIVIWLLLKLLRVAARALQRTLKE
jgi:PiT family inorganic phosphate transporter